MKHLLIAILGAVFAWTVLSFILKDWNSDGLIFLILGTVLGYYTRKQAEEKIEE